MGKDRNWEDEGLASLARVVAARRHLEEVERALRVQLRGGGVSWARLGALYGVSRQAARQRFSREERQGDPPTGPTD